MARKAALLTLLLLLGATSLLAEVNLGINLGIRDQDDEDHSFGVFGLTCDFGGNSWIVRPEVGAFTSFDPFDGGSKIEKSLGLVHSWRWPRFRVNLGAGVASIPAQALLAEGSSTGGYVHGGVEYVREEGSAFGLDLRAGRAGEVEDGGDRFSVDYVQVAFVIHWHIKGPKPQ